MATPQTSEMKAALAGKTQSSQTNSTIAQVRAAANGGAPLPLSRPQPTSAPLPRENKVAAPTFAQKYGK